MPSRNISRVSSADADDSYPVLNLSMIEADFEADYNLASSEAFNEYNEIP